MNEMIDRIKKFLLISDNKEVLYSEINNYETLVNLWINTEIPDIREKIIARMSCVVGQCEDWSDLTCFWWNKVRRSKPLVDILIDRIKEMIAVCEDCPRLNSLYDQYSMGNEFFQPLIRDRLLQLADVRLPEIDDYHFLIDGRDKAYCSEYRKKISDRIDEVNEAEVSKIDDFGILKKRLNESLKKSRSVQILTDRMIALNKQQLCKIDDYDELLSRLGNLHDEEIKVQIENRLIELNKTQLPQVNDIGYLLQILSKREVRFKSELKEQFLGRTEELIKEFISEAPGFEKISEIYRKVRNFESDSPILTTLEQAAKKSLNRCDKWSVLMRYLSETSYLHINSVVEDRVKYLVSSIGDTVPPWLEELMDDTNDITRVPQICQKELAEALKKLL